MMKTMTEAIENDLKNLIGQKNYPCVAAVQALYKKELLYDVYEDFGSTKASFSLAQNLIRFKEKQLQTQTPYLTYFAVFPMDQATSEEDFENKLWAELSGMWKHPEIAGQWDPSFSDNPEDKNFCFSLDGSAFFVVGLHPLSSRESRRLPYCALVFNLYSQFTALMEKGTYHSMVEANRQRDLKFQGSVNPMAEAHNDNWEAIQFSGRNNSSDWKCPFFKSLFGMLRTS